MTRIMIFRLLKVKALVLLFFVLTTAVSTNGQKVKVISDPAADLTKYKTYGWAEGSAVANPLVNQYIVSAVDNEMLAKGLTKVKSEPDLIVVSIASTESELYVTTPSWTPAMGSISTGIASGSQRWPVTKGTLVVDISDAKTKNNLWRGTATHTLENGPTGNPMKDAQRVEKPIQKAVQKMFKQFPGDRVKK